MKARVKDSHPYFSTTSCGGVLFVKSLWTTVPEGREKEALANPNLEIEGVGESSIGDAVEEEIADTSTIGDAVVDGGTTPAIAPKRRGKK